MRHELKGKTVLVAGMGKSGVAAVELLLRHSARVVAVDLNPADQLQSLRISVTAPSPQAFLSADLIVLSPGVPADLPEITAAKAKGIPVIGEVELAGYFLQGPAIGITGSNGKTTTTAMIGHLLQTAGIPNQVGGNIGKAPASMIDSSEEKKWNVLELSSFQLETIEEFRVHIGVGLNVTPDHLDRHGTMEKYADAKARMFESQRAGDSAVLNADDPVTTSWVRRTQAEVWWFSRNRRVDQGVYVSGNQLELQGKPFLRIADIPLRGVHNVENTMAAALAAHLAGAGFDSIADGVRTFAGVEHRIEFVRERAGVLYYNDSKATNVDATGKAIDAFDGNLWIILGGKDKNSDYTVLRESLGLKAKGILLIGAAASKIAAQLPALPLIQCGVMDKAVEHAASHAESGDVVLLAPACASFDQFTSFEHRGRVFKELVRSL